MSRARGSRPAPLRTGGDDDGVNGIRKTVQGLWWAAAMIGLVTLPAFARMPAARAFDFSPVTKIQLPGAAGHGDWVAYDPTTHAMYIALHKSGVAVVDTVRNRVLAEVQPIADPNGIAYDRAYLYVASGSGNELVVVRKAGWQIVGRVPTKGKTPDGVWVDAPKHLVLVSSDDQNWVEAYRAGAHPRWLATYPLEPNTPKSGPDVGVLVPSLGVLYMPDDAMVEALNIDTGKVTTSVDTGVPVTKTGGTKNMVYDPIRNLLWVGTTAHKTLVLDATTLKTVATVPARGGADELAFDPALRLVYAFEGSAKGFDVYNADTLRPVIFVSTGVGNTHTGAVDLSNDRVYAYEGDADAVGVYTPFGEAGTAK